MGLLFFAITMYLAIIGLGALLMSRNKYAALGQMIFSISYLIAVILHFILWAMLQ